MDRESIINILNDLCKSPIDNVRGEDGFLGPYCPIDTMEDWEKVHHDAFGKIDFASLDILFDILQNPPDMKNWYYEFTDGFMYELTEAVCEVGGRDTLTCLKKVESLLNIEQIRPSIIDIIGGLRHHAGIELLERILLEKNLNENEIIRLSQALCEIGGIEAKQVLEKMKIKFFHGNTEVLDKIKSGLTDFK